MILISNQMKARKLFWEKCLEGDWPIYFQWWGCFQRRKNEKQRIYYWKRKYVISSMKPKYKDNSWGGININRKISLYFFSKNMNSGLYINILKEKFPEMKRLVHRIFILVRDNKPTHTSKQLNSL